MGELLIHRRVPRVDRLDHAEAVLHVPAPEADPQPHAQRRLRRPGPPGKFRPGARGILPGAATRHSIPARAHPRASSNPVEGWYGLKKGLRGRFGMYVPPLMEALGLAEVEHNPKNNRMRAI